MRYLRTVCITLSLVPLAPSEENKAGLKGLREVSVNVLASTIVTGNGLSQKQIETDIELRLRRGGIGVVDGMELLREARERQVFDEETKRRVDRFAGMGQMNTYVEALEREGVIFYFIRMELMQKAKLWLNEAGALATTWSDYEFGTVGRRRVEDIRSTITDLCDRLINLWMAANPGTNISSGPPTVTPLPASDRRQLIVK